jgi:hypothetical protein
MLLSPNLFKFLLSCRRARYELAPRTVYFPIPDTIGELFHCRPRLCHNPMQCSRIVVPVVKSSVAPRLEYKAEAISLGVHDRLDRPWQLVRNDQFKLDLTRIMRGAKQWCQRPGFPVV